MVAQHTALQTRGLTKAFPARGGESTVALEAVFSLARAARCQVG